MWRDGQDLLVLPLCFDRIFFWYFFSYTLHLSTCLSDWSTSMIHNNKNVCLSLFQSTKCQHMWRSVGICVRALNFAVQSTDMYMEFFFSRCSQTSHAHTYDAMCAYRKYHAVRVDIITPTVMIVHRVAQRSTCFHFFGNRQQKSNEEVNTIER